MSKIKIDKNDKNRVLLTELLPYEVPMLFSNDGFYSIVKSNEHENFFKKINRKKDQYQIPFNYDIAKSNDGDTRCLSIIHPVSQINFIDFYDKYDSIIIHLCSKSPFSLRRVNKIAKYCYSPDLVFDEDEHKSAEVETEPDILDEETKIFKSYFTYQPIDLIYKFYDRNEYQRLEQRFDLLYEFDISKCFYHIYTHTISWAIKDKQSAKKFANASTFENTFDKIMQWANWNETNGIVVGPEISRIFAEVILQQIDLNVLKKLDLEGYKFGIDYEIRRYVDDFFAFSNDEKILEIILKIYKRELSHYKLYINTEKTEKRCTPFITSIAVGKREVKKLVKNLFDNIIKVEASLEATKEKSFSIINILPGTSQNFIKDFQCIVRQNNLTYDIVNKEVIRLFKRQLTILFKKKAFKADKESASNFFIMFLDVLFYCYSLNINTSATFKMAQIIVLIIKYCEGKELDFKHNIFSKIAKEAEFVMTSYHRKTKVTETNIETINLLIALKKLGTEYLVTEKKIREYFNLEAHHVLPALEIQKFIKLNYFQIISLLYYFDNNIEYEKIKKILENSVLKKFELETDPFTKAEFTCLFFDFICCPFVEDKSKRKLIAITNYVKKDYTTEIKLIESKKTWFMNWDVDIDLEAVLKKKEWSASY